MSFFSFPSQVNERAARVVAAVVATTLAAAFALHAAWIVPLMALGFLLRVGWGPRFSPLARAAMWTASRLGPPRPVSGSPKRFAQGMGAACTVTASVLFAVGATSAAWGIVALIVCFALLEAAFAFCMGCRIYAQLQRTGLLPPDVCIDCNPRRVASGGR